MKLLFSPISRHNISLRFKYCSQTPSVYVLPLMSATKFYTIQNHRENYSFVTLVKVGQFVNRFVFAVEFRLIYCKVAVEF
jgi:hypothetical protein